MIYYATDSNTRSTTYGFLMVVAVTIQYAVAPYVSNLNSYLGFSLASPTAFFIFWVLFLIYDNYVWRIRIARFPFSRIPNFSGEWVGYIERRMEFVATGKTYVQKFGEMIAVQIYIGQTYRKITLRLRSMSTDHSLKGQESECTSAGIFSQDFDHPKLQYTWTRQELCGEGILFLKRDNVRLFIEGNYSSNHPRVGFMRLTRKERKENWGCGLLKVIQTSGGERYLGIHIPEGDVIPYLKQMRSYLSAENYSVYTENQSMRDDGGFHLTVLEPKEFASIGSEKIAGVADTMRVWLNFVGLGRQTRGSEESYYCVVSSDGAQQLRHKFGFGNKDMHVTLGFKNRDLHGVPKGADTLIVAFKRTWPFGRVQSKST